MSTLKALVASGAYDCVNGKGYSVFDLCSGEVEKQLKRKFDLKLYAPLKSFLGEKMAQICFKPKLLQQQLFVMSMIRLI